MRDLKIELNGSAGHILVSPGWNCGNAVSGLKVELESDIPARQHLGKGPWLHGGVMNRDDMKKLRDMIDAELAKPV